MGRSGSYADPSKHCYTNLPFRHHHEGDLKCGELAEDVIEKLEAAPDSLREGRAGQETG
jgi:hypothetical protein